MGCGPIPYWRNKKSVYHLAFHSVCGSGIFDILNTLLMDRRLRKPLIMLQFLFIKLQSPQNVLFFKHYRINCKTCIIYGDTTDACTSRCHEDYSLAENTSVTLCTML